MEIILTIWLAGSTYQPWMRVHMDSYRDCRTAVDAIASVMGPRDGHAECHVDGELRAWSGSSSDLRRD